MSQRKLNRRVLILCEGVTEKLYATSFRSTLSRNLQRSISVEVALGDLQDPLNLVKEAIVKRKKADMEKNSYDSVWLFFDHDYWPQLKEAFTLIEREGFDIAFTSLCLEHWFILHFEDCGRAFQRGDEALRHLRGLWPEFYKTKLNHYAVLQDKIDIAIQRARSMNKRSEDSPIFEKNPYCSIPGLIDLFRFL